MAWPISDRSIDMTITATPLASPPNPKSRRWMMGEAAAAIGLVIGLVALTACDTGSPAPAAQPTAPAVTIPPTNIEIAEQFITALNERDLATLQSIMGTDAEFYDDFSVDALPELVTGLEAWEWRSEDVTCEAQADDFDVQCATAEENRLTELTGVEFPGDVRFRMTDGKVTFMELEADFSEYGPNAFAPFEEWITTNHPDDAALIFQQDMRVLTGEVAALLDQHLTSYSDDYRSVADE